MAKKASKEQKYQNKSKGWLTPYGVYQLKHHCHQIYFPQQTDRISCFGDIFPSQTKRRKFLDPRLIW